MFRRARWVRVRPVRRVRRPRVPLSAARKWIRILLVLAFLTLCCNAFLVYTFQPMLFGNLAKNHPVQKTLAAYEEPECRRQPSLETTDDGALVSDARYGTEWSILVESDGKLVAVFNSVDEGVYNQHGVVVVRPALDPGKDYVATLQGADPIYPCHFKAELKFSAEGE